MATTVCQIPHAAIQHFFAKQAMSNQRQVGL